MTFSAKDYLNQNGKIYTLIGLGIFVGELALDEKLRHVNDMLSIVTMVRERGYRTFFVPKCDAKEAALIPDIPVDTKCNIETTTSWHCGRNNALKFNIKSKV